MTVIRIATRKSPLALWQANFVSRTLEQKVPGLSCELVEMSTEGDRFLSAPLSQIGGKGTFVKEIEQALLDGRADVAVHSLKDMTSTLPDGLVLTAVVEREDPRDAFVSPDLRTIKDLPSGAVVGTSSQRRACQLLARRPDLKVVSIRGNVQSRLRKMEEQKLAGVLLAAAGLRRLGLESRIAELLDVSESLPAVGQGVLAIECRTSDAQLRQTLSVLENARSRVEITAERAFLKTLEGGCSIPVACHAEASGQLRVRALVGRPDGTKIVRAERLGAPEDAERMGREVGEEILGRGGREILRELAQ